MSELNYEVKIKGAAETLRQVPEVMRQITDLEYHQIPSDVSIRAAKDGSSILEWRSDFLQGWFDVDDIKCLYNELLQKLPGLEVYLSVDLTHAGIVHTERGALKSGEWSWDCWVGLVLDLEEIYGMTDRRGKTYTLNPRQIAGFDPDHFNIPAMEEDNVDVCFHLASGGSAVLQLSPDGAWRCVLEEMGDWSEAFSDDEADRLFDDTYSFFAYNKSNDDPAAWTGLCRGEDILAILSAVLPDTKLHIEDCGGIPHFLDNEGNEYFTGKMISYSGGICTVPWEYDNL